MENSMHALRESALPNTTKTVWASLYLRHMYYTLRIRINDVSLAAHFRGSHDFRREHFVDGSAQPAGYYVRESAVARVNDPCEDHNCR